MRPGHFLGDGPMKVFLHETMVILGMVAMAAGSLTVAAVLYILFFGLPSM